MSYLRTVPANRIEPLAWLGKTNWATPTKHGYRSSERDINAILHRAVRFGMPFYEQVRQIINLSLIELTPDGPRRVARTSYSDRFFMASQVLATGQKMIQLSSDWCEAFENTELSLQFKDYRQSFPTMVVELPLNYAQSKLVPGTTDYPECIAVHHDPQEQVVLVQVVSQNANMTTLIDYTPDQFVESKSPQVAVVAQGDLGYVVDNRLGDYLTPLLRIALNAIVAMTYGEKWESRSLVPGAATPKPP